MTDDIAADLRRLEAETRSIIADFADTMERAVAYLEAGEIDQAATILRQHSEGVRQRPPGTVVN